ncbi:MAG: 30S ribosomal protein S17 [Patescibacteria group bacterium]
MTHKLTHNSGRSWRGEVVSDKPDKTVVVRVNRFVKHPKYGKFLKRSKRYQAHDEKNEYKVGDRVVIREVRPLSRHKHFVVVSKISS